MSAADAFIRATINALSASVRVTGPLADLMYRVLPSTLSMVPATRWVCCCADAVETANTAVKAAAATIRIVIISHLPNGDTPASIQRSAGIAKEAERGACEIPTTPPARPRLAFAYRPRSESTEDRRPFLARCGRSPKPARGEFRGHPAIS